MKKKASIFLFLFFACTIWAENPVFTSIEEGNLEKLINTLDILGLDIDHRDEKGNTLLLKAAFQQQKTILTWLIENGAQVNVKNDYGETPLSASLSKGDFEIGKLLIDNGFDVTEDLTLGNSTGSYLEYGVSRLLYVYAKNITNTARLIKLIYNTIPEDNKERYIGDSFGNYPLFWSVVGNVEKLKNAIREGGGLEGVVAMATVSDNPEVLEFINLIEPIEIDNYLNFYPVNANLDAMRSLREIAEQVRSVKVLEWIAIMDEDNGQ